ncbi:peptidase M15 [Paenibacillus sp. BIHB 4019]|uniref:Peptidase M15 n=1 Tax=Paenibacillus sp. BIHB 4019 TaxID=1870819 RepID=A0A1B2DM84_9BACL|nr:D-alanyl-D-alanine carboxypeptidase family protein [Paenibacillus sp. BIHB 4019]ANY68818.1 peptidase M15 [Paenibacillus sp. BIHB 4019]
MISIVKIARILLLLGLAFCLTGTSLPAPGYAAEPEPLSTHASASALIDVTSGRLLYSEDGDKPMLIASLTKIMTAIVAIEHGNLSGTVKTGKRAVGKEGSSIYLQLNEEMKLQDMLYGLMLRSGNDAATAIAEHVGGSEEGFVVLMNEKAAFLGMNNSQFKNPHGLDEEGHYSSANDLAKLAAYALRNPVFAKIVSTPVKQVPNPHEQWQYKWVNKNKMLQMYEGADGVKTGYTKQALRCLVSSATRDGQQLAAVTLSDGDDWADHRHMLDWGFEHYPLAQIAGRGQALAGYPYAVGQSFSYPLTEEEKGQLTSRLVVVNAATTRYALGERGTLEWYMNGAKIGAVPIYNTGSSRLALPERKKAEADAFFNDGLRKESYLAAAGEAIRALFS